MEEQEEEGVVQTNQYMILHEDEVILVDPGGAHVFPGSSQTWRRR
jgi:flavorubredoxin